MSAWFPIATNTFRQVVRQRLFFNVLLFGVGMVLFSMVVGSLTFGFPDRVVRSIGLSGVALALDLMAILVGVNLVHEEIERKTLFVVLARPVPRWTYLLARYLGLLFALCVCWAGLLLVFLLTLVIARGTPSLNDFLAILAVIPEAAILEGVAVVLSTFTTPTLGAGMALGLWIASATTDDLLALSKEDPVMHRFAELISYLLPSLDRFDFREAAVYAMTISPTDYLAVIAYAVVYSAALVALGGFLLSRREMI